MKKEYKPMSIKTYNISSEEKIAASSCAGYWSYELTGSHAYKGCIEVDPHYEDVYHPGNQS